ncbi:MAG: hypothetical protein KDA41_11105, partial [Planctomycetales bacterium]|nr:hypothetical protein [Planctomycetales bacterium]
IWMQGAALLALAASVYAVEPQAVPAAIEEVAGVNPLPTAFTAAKRSEPLELKDAEAAAVYFDAEALAKLVSHVDFSKQVVLVFAWRGSGQDKLTFAVAEAKPEQIRFTILPGRTRDLRQHTKVFVLRSDVVWKVGG